MPPRPAPSKAPAVSTAPPGMVRLQRHLAAAGVAARRACERLIEDGHVRVNGKVVRTLPAFINPAEDHVSVDGRPIQRAAPRKIYLMVNKPARMLSITSDEPGLDRPTVLDIVQHPARARLVPVGRLDYDTMGLVLLTNDGELVNRLTHPRYGVAKTYHATVRSNMDDTGLRLLEASLNKAQRKDDKRLGRAAPSEGQRVELALVSRGPTGTVISVTLREGRTGNIAKMLTGAGAPVKALERVAIGPLELKAVARGRWRELERNEIRALQRAARGIPDRTPGPEPRAAGRRPTRGPAPADGPRGPRGPRARTRSRGPSRPR